MKNIVMNNNTGVYVVVVVFALLVLAGFYMVFDKLSALSTDIKNMQLQQQLAEQQKNPLSQTPPATPPPTAPPAGGSTSTPAATDNRTTDISIPTAIIFDASSSPALQPQSKLTVTIENVTREINGTLTVGIKVFTGEAQGYSSLEPRTLFSLVNLTGDNVAPSLVTGSFNSMPAKGAISGTVVFTTDPARTTLILQVGTPENPTFYEFNFSTKTYKETVIG